MRLQVAVQDAPAVGVLHRIADSDQAANEETQFAVPSGTGRGKLLPVMQPGDCFRQSVAADEAHGIKRPAIGKLPQTVHRHDGGMLQAAGHFRLQQEALPATLISGKFFEDFFQGHFAVQLAVIGDGNLSQSAPGMGPENTEALGRIIISGRLVRGSRLSLPRRASANA